MEENLDLQMERVGLGQLCGHLKPQLQSVGSDLLLYIRIEASNKLLGSLTVNPKLLQSILT